MELIKLKLLDTDGMTLLTAPAAGQVSRSAPHKMTGSVLRPSALLPSWVKSACVGEVIPARSSACC